MKAKVRCVVDGKNDLGEGPLWCPIDRALYWVDVTARKMYRYAPSSGHTREWELPKLPGSYAFRENGAGMIMAFRTGLALYDLDRGTLDPIEDPVIDLDRGRFNDGKCDRKGRFWTGTIDRRLKDPVGALYRIDRDRSVHRMDGGVTLSNGIAWSPDNRTMYYCDSRPGRVYAYDFDLETGAIRNRRVFADLSGGPGRPDGCTVDAEGFLWVAHVGAGNVLRFAPDGRIDRTIDLPVQKPTSVMFGGDNLDILFVTSMRYEMTDAELSKQPLAGGLFAVEVGVRGLPEPRFAG